MSVHSTARASDKESFTKLYCPEANSEKYFKVLRASNISLHKTITHPIFPFLLPHYALTKSHALVPIVGMIGLVSAALTDQATIMPPDLPTQKCECVQTHQTVLRLPPVYGTDPFLTNVF